MNSYIIKKNGKTKQVWSLSNRVFYIADQQYRVITTSDAPGGQVVHDILFPDGSVQRRTMEHLVSRRHLITYQPMNKIAKPKTKQYEIR